MRYHKLYKNDIPADLFLDIHDNAIAIDTEAMGLINMRDRLCVVQFSVGDGQAHIVHFLADSDYQAPNLKKLLQDPQITKIFHFARFDLAIIYRYLGVWCQPCYCTKLASRIARTYSPYHSLKELCFELLRVRLNKQQQCSDWGSKTLSPEQIDYAASDVIHLHAIKRELDQMLKREKREVIAQKCFEFLPLRAELDLLGWAPEDIFSHA